MFIRTEILNRNMLCYTQNNKPIDTNKLAPINQSFWQEFRSLFQDLKKKHEVTRSLVPSHAYVCENFCSEIITVKKPHRNRLRDKIK